MDISILSETSIKIKGKTASFAIDPRNIKGKVEVDAVIVCDNDVLATDRIESSRLTIQGPGEYEIGGVKISGVKSQNHSLYYLSLDNMVVMVGKASDLKGKESIRDADIVVIHADSVVDTSLLATLNPKTAVFYGEFAKANGTALGKEVTPVGKYIITRDKLPAELEAVLLQ